jgi:L-iditol 2-dehydrogenase
MSDKMKTSLFYGNKEEIEVKEIDVPGIGDGDVLLKINTCGICGSDARYYFNGNEERYKKPVILGHELCGSVFKMGKNVKNLSIGDRVVLAPIYGCGICDLCTSGFENLCRDVVVFGCTYDGGLAEYMFVPESGVKRGAIVKIGDSLSDLAATMVEPFSCALHGLRRMNIQPGDSVAIFGAGPIGLAHMMISKRLGARGVAIIDLAENRLIEAKTFGADFTINASNETSWKKEIFEIFGEDGADNVITAAPSLVSIENALKIVKRSGSVLIFGGLPHGNLLKVDPNYIHYNEISVMGSIDSTIDDFKRTVQMSHLFGLDRFATHVFSLENIKEGMQVMKKKEGLKVIVDMNKR